MMSPAGVIRAVETPGVEPSPRMTRKPGAPTCTGHYGGLAFLEWSRRGWLGIVETR